MWGQAWGTMIWTKAPSHVPAMGFWGLVALGAAMLFVGYTFLKRGVRPGAIGLTVLVLAFVLPISGALAALPFTFANGTVADANQVNANFQAHDNSIAAEQSSIATLQSTAFTTVSVQSLNTTDSPSASWQPFATTCIQQIATNGGLCSSGNGCAALPVACTLAAMRKCASPDGLGYRFGLFVGEDPGNSTKSIVCVK